MSNLPLYERLIDARIKPVNKIGAQVLDIARVAVPFDVTNVENWVEETHNGEAFVDLFEKMPACVPVYPVMALEWVIEDVRGSGNCLLLLTTSQRGKRYLVDDENWSFYGPTKEQRWSEKPPTPSLLSSEETKQYSKLFVIPEGGFLTHGVGLVQHIATKSEPEVISCGVTIGYDAEGVLLRTETHFGVRIFGLDEALAADPTYQRMTEKEKDRTSLEMGYFTATGLFSCALMHCKNVTERHERPNRQESRERERRKLPPLVWKTLVVEPLRKPTTPRETADVLDEKYKRRMHLVRGHFAEYGVNGKGKLFGKYSGRFWIPPTVKGSEDVGKVAKDYRVKGTLPG